MPFFNVVVDDDDDDSDDNIDSSSDRIIDSKLDSIGNGSERKKTGIIVSNLLSETTMCPQTFIVNQ